MFLKTKRKEEIKSERNILIGMIMLHDDQVIDLSILRKILKKQFGNSINNLNGDNASFTFQVDNEVVGVGHIPAPIPHSDIEGAAKYAYNWETALEDLKNHKTHLIVTIMPGGRDQVKRFRLFTKVICILLKLTNSIGVYKGSQSLLILKEDYLDIAEEMTEDNLPLNLWINFLYRKSEKGNSASTYGLKEFGKYEMEIVESVKTIGEIEMFLYNMTHYVIEYDVTFMDGQTCGMSEDEQIPIKLSKGKFLETETFKLGY